MSTDNDEAYEEDNPGALTEPATHSDTHSLCDLQLEPFNAQRFMAAQAAGMRWPVAKEEYRNDGGLYKGELMDACLALWLCTLPIDQDKDNRGAWYVKKVLARPEQAQDAALVWGADLGISMPDSDAFWDAIDTFEKIISQINKAYVAAKGSTPKD